MNKYTTPSRRNRYATERDSREQRIARQWQAATKPAPIITDEDGIIYWGGAK